MILLCWLGLIFLNFALIYGTPSIQYNVSITDKLLTIDRIIPEERDFMSRRGLKTIIKYP